MLCWYKSTNTDANVRTSRQLCSNAWRRTLGCFTTALLLLYYCFTIALLLLYYCFNTALLLLYYFCTTASRQLCSNAWRCTWGATRVPQSAEAWRRCVSASVVKCVSSKVHRGKFSSRRHARPAKSRSMEKVRQCVSASVLKYTVVN